MEDEVSTRQLDFYQAMSDFRHMFPNMDEEVIEAVLRANNGAVDETIDQLLTMNVDSTDSTTKSTPNETGRNYMNQRDLPPQYQESSTSSDDDEPPPYPPPNYQNYGQSQNAARANMQIGIPTSESVQSLQSPDAVDTANDILLNLAGLPPFDTSPQGPSPGVFGATGGAVGKQTNVQPQASASVHGAFGGDDLDAGAVGGICAADTNGSALAVGGASAFPFEEEDETEVKKPLDRFNDFSPTHHPVSMPPKMSILDHDYTGSTAARKKRFRDWNPPMLGTLPDDFLRIMITPEASPTRCPAHPHPQPSPLAQQNSTSSSPRHHRFSPHHHLHSRSSVSPSRPSLSRAETLPHKVDNATSSPKIKNKDTQSNHSSTGKSRTFGFRSRRQKSEADVQKHKPDTDEQLTHTLRKNPLAAAHGKEEINSSIIQQKLSAIEKCNKSSLSAEEAQAMEDERLALMIQNQEFMDLLKRDSDFMKTLEKDRLNATAFEPRSDSPELDPNRPPSNKLEGYGSDKQGEMGAFPFSQPMPKDEDDELRQHLKHMGGTSKKKFTALAKNFFSRKKKKIKQPISFTKEAGMPSTMNLLEEDLDDDEEPLNPLTDDIAGLRTQRDGDLASVPDYMLVQRPMYHPDCIVTKPQPSDMC